MNTQTTRGYQLHESGVWLSLDDYTLSIVQELIPTDWPLEFHLTFIQAIVELNLDSVGIYCNGWEL